MTTAAEWLAAFADRAGISVPSETERELLLELAGVAAHASERPAAPLTTFLVGRAGMRAGDALELARRLSSELGRPEPEETAPRSA